jgi:hypothetical protein
VCCSLGVNTAFGYVSNALSLVRFYIGIAVYVACVGAAACWSLLVALHVDRVRPPGCCTHQMKCGTSTPYKPRQKHARFSVLLCRKCCLAVSLLTCIAVLHHLCGYSCQLMVSRSGIQPLASITWQLHPRNGVVVYGCVLAPCYTEGMSHTTLCSARRVGVAAAQTTVVCSCRCSHLLVVVLIVHNLHRLSPPPGCCAYHTGWQCCSKAIITAMMASSDNQITTRPCRGMCCVWWLPYGRDGQLQLEFVI